jgi:hypothetical protein
MSIEPTYIVYAVLIGLGATLVMDLYALFLKRVFDVALPNYCFVGRWLRHMPQGTFRHASIGTAPQKQYECTVGWIAHYLIGVAFAFAFVLIAPASWLQRPSPLPSILFGIVTVLLPFLVMHPSFGLGIAASRTPNPAQARIRSLMAHTVFGVGLYLCAVVVSQVLRAHA